MQGNNTRYFIFIDLEKAFENESLEKPKEKRSKSTID